MTETSEVKPFDLVLLGGGGALPAPDCGTTIYGWEHTVYPGEIHVVAGGVTSAYHRQPPQYQQHIEVSLSQESKDFIEDGFTCIAFEGLMIMVLLMALVSFTSMSNRSR